MPGSQKSGQFWVRTPRRLKTQKKNRIIEAKSDHYY
jgi:hypothetical protein